MGNQSRFWSRWMLRSDTTASGIGRWVKGQRERRVGGSILGVRDTGGNPCDDLRKHAGLAHTPGCPTATPPMVDDDSNDPTTKFSPIHHADQLLSSSRQLPSSARQGIVLLGIWAWGRRSKYHIKGDALPINLP